MPPPVNINLGRGRYYLPNKAKKLFIFKAGIGKAIQSTSYLRRRSREAQAQHGDGLKGWLVIRTAGGVCGAPEVNLAFSLGDLLWCQEFSKFLGGRGAFFYGCLCQD